MYFKRATVMKPVVEHVPACISIASTVYLYCTPLHFLHDKEMNIELNYICKPIFKSNSSDSLVVYSNSFSLGSGRVWVLGEGG